MARRRRPGGALFDDPVSHRLRQLDRAAQPMPVGLEGLVVREGDTTFWHVLLERP